MAGDSESDTVDDRPVPPAGAGPAPVVLAVDAGGLTHPGKVRPTNEDHFHIVQFGRYLRTMASSLPAGKAAGEGGVTGYGFAVADGVGGQAGGEVASGLAIALLIDSVLLTPDWILGRGDHLLTEVMDRFAVRFKVVNQAVIAHARTRPGLAGMGTTLSLALSLDDDLLVAHLGDSRVYLSRRGQFRRLTRDHSASRPVDDPAASGPIRFRRVLTHAIGLPQTGGEPDLYHYKLEDGDRLLLCTDGLTDMVDDWAIGRELGRAADPAEACRALVDLALGRGGRDNVTAVVASYRLPDPPGPRPAG